jgi:hypothetical protein
MAHFDAVYDDANGVPHMPLMDEMFTMAPPPLVPISAPPCFKPRNVPIRLMSSVRRSSSIDVFTIGVNGPSTPALFTSTWRAPPHDAMADSHDDSSVTSRWT